MDPAARVQQRQRGGGIGSDQSVCAAEPTQIRVRVVADTSGNTLLVWATPLDYITINKLLETIDSPEKDVRGLLQTNFIRCSNTKADEVSVIIRDVYADLMNTQPQRGNVGGFPGGFLFPGAFAGLGGGGGGGRQNNQPSLSVGVDTGSNTLIVASSEGVQTSSARSTSSKSCRQTRRADRQDRAN